MSFRKEPEPTALYQVTFAEWPDLACASPFRIHTCMSLQKLLLTLFKTGPVESSSSSQLMFPSEPTSVARSKPPRGTGPNAGKIMAGCSYEESPKKE